MGGASRHHVYSRDAVVHMVTGATKQDAFDRAMADSGFFDDLEARWLASGKPRADFLIAIKPNIMTASKRLEPNPTYTDPELVEHLIDRMHAQGFRNIAVVESQNVYNYSYQDRSVGAVAEMVGYSGRNYRIVDLSDEKEPFDYGSVMGRHFVGRTWRDADLRISFAKNKSHWQCFYTGCIKCVYGCLPEWDKMHHYHGRRREFYECAVLCADRFPVHFGFIDAWVSGDGFSGHVRDADPNVTRTIFVSNNIFAIDWVMGEKMGVDPSLNYVLQEGMYRWGTIKIERRGNLTTWDPWKNLRPFTIIALDAIEEAYHLSRFLSRSFASEMDERFKPVARTQWLFGILQAFSRLIEGVFETKSDIRG